MLLRGGKECASVRAYVERRHRGRSPQGSSLASARLDICPYSTNHDVTVKDAKSGGTQVLRRATSGDFLVRSSRQLLLSRAEGSAARRHLYVVPSRRQAQATRGVSASFSVNSLMRNPRDKDRLRNSSDWRRRNLHPWSRNDWATRRPLRTNRCATAPKNGRCPSQRVRRPARSRSASKGILLTGTFTPSKDAQRLAKAAVFSSGTVPITARFSDFTRIPEIPDTVGDANPRGLAIKFKLPGDASMDIVAHSFNGFPTANANEIGYLLRAIGTSGPEAKKPTDIDEFLATHPIAKTFLTTQKPAPVSYGTLAYFGVNWFKFTSASGQSQFVRYRFVPRAGEQFLDSAALKSKGPNYWPRKSQRAFPTVRSSTTGTRRSRQRATLSPIRLSRGRRAANSSNSEPSPFPV